MKSILILLAVAQTGLAYSWWEADTEREVESSIEETNIQEIGNVIQDFVSLWWPSTYYCGDDYYGTYGTIVSPNYTDNANYPNNAYCVWRVEAPSGMKIQVEIESLDMESCCDYLEIRDGKYEHDPVLARLTGHNDTYDDIFSTDRYLYFKFISDGSVTDEGFYLNWYADYCGGDYAGTKGVITSPNYPGSYTDGTTYTCLWTVTTPTNSRITVTFEDFKLDGYDYLEIRNGNDSNAELIEKCTYYSPCDDIRSSANTLYLKFYSDVNSYSAKGFKLIWFSDPGCGGDYAGTKGAIASTNHPNDYPNDIDCVYTLVSPINTTISINFESFETSDSYDYLQIRDGTDMNAPLLEKCSETSCNNTKSTNNSLYIHFHTSSEDQAGGFKLNWYSAHLPYYCGNDYHGTHGTIVSPYYTYNGSYPNNAYCEWTVEAPWGMKIGVEIKSLDMESCCDYLEIRDGKYHFDPVLAKLTGHNDTYDDIFSTDRYLYFNFISDNSVTDKGFYLNWTTAEYFCNDGYTYGREGTIMSPNYPDHYPDKADCIWYIRSPPLTQITVNFESFHTDNNDYLYIRDGNDQYTSPLLLKLSGYHPTVETITTTGNALTVVFTSDYSGTETGFKFNWYAEIRPIFPSHKPQTTTTTTTTAPSGGLQCYSCIGCENIDDDTNVVSSDDYLACFVAVQIGADHFVFRGGSPDYFEDGSCRHEADGAIVCYCTSNLCNDDAALELLHHGQYIQDGGS